MKTVKAWAIVDAKGRFPTWAAGHFGIYDNWQEAKGVHSPWKGEKIIRVEIRPVKDKRK